MNNENHLLTSQFRLLFWLPVLFSSQVLALMWGINNLSRPFRIAGAIALAPVIDRRVVKPVGAFFSRLRDGKRNS